MMRQVGEGFSLQAIEQHFFQNAKILIHNLIKLSDYIDDETEVPGQSHRAEPG